MLFAQFANCQSVRDIANGLRSAAGNLNHLGMDGAPSKSNLSYKNGRRDWTLFKDLYFALLKDVGQHKAARKALNEVESKVYLLDSTVIALTLSLFDWATYKTSKGAVKMHTLLYYEGSIPAFVNITDGKVGDNNGAKPIPKGAVVVADRYYADFELLNVWDSTDVNFVVRHKSNLSYEVVEDRLASVASPPETILADEIILLKGAKTKKKYAQKLRRVAIWDKENQDIIEVVTNQVEWKAETISQLYKSRWEIEIFFRDIKQNLSIKSFVGTSQNAVCIQIWSALITILLLKTFKKEAHHKWYLSNLIAHIRLNLFVKMDLMTWLNNPFPKAAHPPDKYTQGVLF